MSYDTLNEYVPVETRLRDFLSRHGLRMAGIGTIALSGALLASLITWHVDDPSFSYVVDGGARNILGLPGAAFADLAMQFFGFAIIGIVLPLLVTGWNFTRLRRPRRPIRQCLAWLCGALLLATAFSCLPVFGSWPLPTGMGGATGDVTLRILASFGGGELSGGLYAALFVVLAGVATGLLWASCLSRPIEAAPARPARRRARARETEEAESEEEENASVGRLRLVAGFLGHWALALRGMIGRQIAHQLARRAERQTEKLAGSTRRRREPSFLSDEDMDEVEDPEFDAAFAEAIEEELPVGRPAKSKAVVQSAAPRPKQSSRAKREAQPSFLPSG